MKSITKYEQPSVVPIKKFDTDLSNSYQLRQKILKIKRNKNNQKVHLNIDMQRKIKN